MSRIGKLPITVPAGVSVDFDGEVVKVKGPKGELTQRIATRALEVKKEGATIELTRKNESKETKSMHGLYRMLIANMVQGVNEPFSKTLVVKGVGYKGSVVGNKLTMNIGFSHPVEIIAPQGIALTATDSQNNSFSITVTGISKELVGQTAASIRAKKPVEPYHHYGIRYSTETPVKKEGKTAGKK
ncbi:MAG: 50S ribosomal protein L6 [Firmicutes bacterium]|nr:50S ribosomal protein L6 [Bacillota bacterium]